jgi:alpha-galactosidase
VHRLVASTVLTASLSTCFGVVAGAQTASLGTAQTVLRVKAGTTAPQLLSLHAPGKAVWSNTAAEDLIATAEEDGQSVPLHWKLLSSAEQRDAKHISFVYETQSPHLRLSWEWSAPVATGPLEHRIRIENLDTRAIWLPLQTSFRYNWSVPATEPLKQIYIDKGAGKPSAIGTHALDVSSGYQWEGKSSSYAKNEEPREIIPWFMVERNGEHGDGWYVGVEFSGRTSLTLDRAAGSLRGTVGLNPNPGPFRTLLQPGATFAAPPVFVGAFTGGRDGLGNVLRPWVRQVLTYSGTWKKPDYPLLVNNSWGSGMAVDEALAKRMIDDSADLGMEMFGLDAGWFRGVGDWYPNPKKFPNGLAPVADEAHRRGLKFGIWVDWAQAGTDTEPGALNVNDPETRGWLVADTPPGWKPDDFVGRTTDIGVPAAKDHAQRELERMITSYKLDMVEHDGYLVAHNCSRSDHPHAPPPPDAVTVIKGSGIAMPDTSNSTDVSYHAVRSYYDIYSHLREQHPDLMFEICNDGGRMVDFGSASHGDYFSITDTYDPLSNRRAFYDTSEVLPAAMLEDYVEKWPTPRLENFRYMLRSGMMGWLTVMQNTNAWTPEEHAAAKQEFALYKEKLRPFIRDANLYHISARPDGVHWDGIEYFDVKHARSVVYAFRGSATDDKAHTFPLHGLQPERQYRLHFQDGSSPDRTESGHDLMSKGLKMALAVPNSSELVFVDEVR